MKIAGIGDLFIPGEYIQEGFKQFQKPGIELKIIDWKLKGFQELQNINLLIETDCSDAYQPADNVLDDIEDAEIIITQFHPVNRTVIDNCKNLKLIGLLRGGYENINVS